ncbi:MAG: glycosyltransferase family 39 protein [Micromonosporaceae bacterium]|nr:glycosyltransferase family 39 protein [Micromonosporaceae bacterium]
MSDIVGSPPATATAAAVRPDSPWRRAWLAGLGTWLIAFVSYLLLNAVFWTMATEKAPPLVEFFNVWNRWDTGHYITIATTGYNPLTENTAFFPLYPLLMRYLDPVLPGEKLAAALIIASAACIAALAVLHRLVEDLFDRSTAQRAALYLMASPFAFYLVAAYNESLLLALCLGSLYCMRRGHWWAAGILGGFASGTRQAGVLLALAFVIEYLRQRDWRISRVRWDVAAVLLVPSGLVAYMVYCAIAFDDPLRFMHIQEFWGRQLSVPWKGVEGALDQIAAWKVESPLHAYVVVNVIDLVSLPVVAGLLVLSVIGPWRLGPSSWYLIAFGVAVFVMVLLSPIGRGLPPLHGLPRYALEIVPIFIVLARIGANRSADRAYLFPAIALQASLLIGYFANVWLS